MSAEQYLELPESLQLLLPGKGTQKLYHYPKNVNEGDLLPSLGKSLKPSQYG
jgi:hypothetical protein